VRWGLGSRVVSNLLRIGERPHPVLTNAFFSGYLPEGQSRVHHAVEAGVEVDDTFGLIATYGRDLAGALIVVREGESPASPEAQYEPIDVPEVARRLQAASRHTGRLDARDSFSSLPGLVPKVLLHREDRQWFACHQGAPSTWIIKRAHDFDGPAADVVDTEVLALRCARRLGLGNVHAEIADLGSVRAIAVARYDRVASQDGTGLIRVHQEDLAQAIGLSTVDANRKFQRGTDRMPSLKHAADVLRAGGSEVDDLLRLVTFNFAVGNTDLHAKNISFLRMPTGVVRLAPAYDVSMHLHAVDNNGMFAMKIDDKSAFADLRADDLVAEGKSWGLSTARAEYAVASTLRALANALDAERRTGKHPGVSDSAWEHVFARVADLGGRH
jgi:serine/threonine-protein kinase HipA